MEVDLGGQVAAQEKIGECGVHQKLRACVIGDNAEAATFTSQDMLPDCHRIVDQEIRAFLFWRSGGAQVCGHRVTQVRPVAPQAGVEQLLETGLHVAGKTCQQALDRGRGYIARPLFALRTGERIESVERTGTEVAGGLKHAAVKIGLRPVPGDFEPRATKEGRGAGIPVERICGFSLQRTNPASGELSIKGFQRIEDIGREVIRCNHVSQDGGHTHLERVVRECAGLGCQQQRRHVGVAHISAPPPSTHASPMACPCAHRARGPARPGCICRRTRRSPCTHPSLSAIFHRPGLTRGTGTS